MVETQDVGGKAAQPGKHAGVRSDAGGVLSERDVTDVVRPVFDVPMAADGIGRQRGFDRTVRQVVADVAGSLPQAGCGVKTLNDPFDRDDGDYSIPPCRAGDDPIGVEDSGNACFVPVAFMPVGCLPGRERRSFTASGFDLMTQGFLVGFQLYDQMDL